MLRKYLDDNKDIILEKLTSFCIVEIYLEYYFYIQKDKQLYRYINMLVIFQYEKICSHLCYIC
jgi:hypothetical protein